MNLLISIAYIVAFVAAMPQQFNSRLNPGTEGVQHKTSAIDPGFAPFDNAPTGDVNDTFPCSNDSDCKSACCDGKVCRAPDALTKGVQTCRNGLTPNFDTGKLQFVKITPSDPAIGGEGSSAPSGTSANLQSSTTGVNGTTDNGSSGGTFATGGDPGNAGNGNTDPSKFNTALNPGANGVQHKTSAIDPGFAPFDNAPTGDVNDTFPCSNDSNCKSACCDGKVCRAPDALTKGVQTCRNGLTPNFDTGKLQFVKITPSDPAIGGEN